ncbi:hypothetical protein [Roseivirga seohaensis]|uniref:Uncharacterized protein n=2 Tax=Roseivirga seohaensis TaxID=1914963 RepID=A0A0L8AKD9_9BACT|nr:hypothetical protein [Roseivirga seohaensis]KOF02913.1 hypothetical protein OB69_08700 [Roseivirga seohaensis subsp. aquiponti]KYG84474.1 hypothetical protein AWW67_05025 [Roseivirga seohaensis]
MDKKALALHLIKQDLKYRQMVIGLNNVGIHIEFYPDLVRVIRALMGHSNVKTLDTWADVYVEGMSKIEKVAWGDEAGLYIVALQIYKSLESFT